MIKIDPDGTVSTIHSFRGGDQGVSPAAPIAVGSRQFLYGVSIDGTIWRVKEDGTLFKVIGNLSGAPYEGVTLAPDGYLYGLTTTGGANGYGFIFRELADGSYRTPEVLYSFSFTDPFSCDCPLVVENGTIYGAGYYGGTVFAGGIFALPTTGAISLTEASFDYYTLGGYPVSLTLANDGNFYGSCSLGGIDGNGTIYKYVPSTNTITSVYTFVDNTDGGGPQDLKLGSDGLLYGTTYTGGIDANNDFGGGTVFTFDPAGTTPTIRYTFLSGQDAGQAPHIAFAPKGQLIGFRPFGGPSGQNGGLLFSLTPKSGKYDYELVHDFGDNSLDGTYPYRGKLIIGQGGSLYGATASRQGVGTDSVLFNIGLDGSNYDQIDSNITGNVYGGLLYAPDGNYYATTYNGGYYAEGSVEQISQSGIDTDFWDFAGDGGASITSGLILGSDGNFYGVSYLGGRYNQGAFFRLGSTSSTEEILYSFTGSNDGGNPNGGLIEGSDGNFYGTASKGGVTNQGTVWQLTGAGKFTLLHTFIGVHDGATPQGGVIEGLNGKLYGTTYFGGAKDLGTVYELSKSGAGFHTIHSFVAGEGTSPYSGLTQTSDGALYGTTYLGGLYGGGTVFSLKTDGTDFKTVHAFAGGGKDGYFPYSALTEAPDGNLYGTTYGGGISNSIEVNARGTIYKIATQLPTITSFSPQSGATGIKVTLVGANLSGVASATVGGKKATLVSQTPTSVVLQTPADVKTGRIVLKFSGTSVTSPSIFTVN